MSTRDRLTVASALAVLLACAALIPVFDGQGWLVRVSGAVLAVAAACAGGRALSLPPALQPVAGVLGLAAYTGLVFAGTTLAYGVVPTGETLAQLGATVRDGLLDVEQLAAPVPTDPGLVLLAVLGAGAIAVAVDTLAVVLRRAATAGLPLLALFAVPSAVLPGGLGVLPFVAGAVGWLGLLVADAGDVVSRWGTPLSAQRGGTGSDQTVGRTGRRIGLAALGVAVVVPALVPGLDARLLGGGNGGGFGGGSRSVTTYNPITTLAGQLSLPTPRELLRYASDDPTPDYLRLTTLDVFDERSGWSSSELSGDPDDDRAQDGLPRPPGLTSADERPVAAQVEVTGNLDGPWLPLPFPPLDVEIDGPWLYDAEAETVFSTRTSLAELENPYRVSASRVEPTVELLRRPQTVPSEIAETYAREPQLSPYVRDELTRVTEAQGTDYDRVAAVQAYFRDASRFRYDEQASTPGLNSPDALENFLRGGLGYCEQYSSAMAALVRGLGIPARVAVGFTPGTLEGRERIVTTSEAHAWPEVWFAGAGWVRFEPTPRSEQTTTPDYTVAPAEVAPDPAASAAPSAGPSTAAPLPQDPASADRGGDGVVGPTADRGRRGLSPWLLAGPVVALLLATPALLAAWRERRRWRRPHLARAGSSGPGSQRAWVDPAPGDDPARRGSARADPDWADAAWAAVVDHAVDVGHRWRTQDSPRAAAAHLLAGTALPAPAAGALQRLAAASERSRYARPTDQPQLPAALRRDAHLVRHGLLATCSRRDRWRARFAPPSTLRWASSGLGSRVADVLDRLDGLVSAVGMRARHPRARRAQ